MYVIARQEGGQEKYLRSFSDTSWTDVLWYAVGFRSEGLAENIASFLANQTDITTYVIHRTG